MSHEPKEEPFSETQLNSPEYRERLMRKLNCLIAVLEVATAKVKKSLSGPDPDVERLTRIQTNLESTLDVCQRARAALERRESLPKELPENLNEIIQKAGMQKRQGPTPQRLPTGAYIEMSTEEERRKFERLGQITRDMFAGCDLDALGRMLQG